MHSTLLGGGHEVHGDLVVVGEQLVPQQEDAAVVAHGYACLVVSKDLVLFYLWERGARADDTRSLVFVNLIVAHVRTRVEHDYAVTVVVDVIVLDPAEASFYAEDTFTPGLVDQIVQYHSVSRVGPSVSYVGLVVAVDLVLLHVRAS